MDDDLLSEVLTTLRRKGCTPRKVGDGVWEARCPACRCAGHTLVLYPPLEVKCISGKLCSRRRVLEALGVRAEEILSRADIKNRSLLARPAPPLAKQLDRDKSAPGRDPARLEGSDPASDSAPAIADLRPVRLAGTGDSAKAAARHTPDTRAGGRARGRPHDQHFGRGAPPARPGANSETKEAPAPPHDEPDAGIVAVPLQQARATVKRPAPPEPSKVAGGTSISLSAIDSRNDAARKALARAPGGRRTRFCSVVPRPCDRFEARWAGIMRR